MLKKLIQGPYYLIYTKLFLRGRYNKKYFTGKWFESPRGTAYSIGWHWAYKNAKMCKKMGVNQDIPWPCSPRISVVHPENISFHPDDLNNFQSFGNYFQAIGKIEIGKGTYIAPNVGIITANHDFSDLDKHLEPKAVTLGEKCWIGMNSMILPGVELGNNTVVGAGSVVTKSFLEGNCVIAGNPAKVIRKL